MPSSIITSHGKCGTYPRAPAIASAVSMSARAPAPAAR